MERIARRLILNFGDRICILEKPFVSPRLYFPSQDLEHACLIQDVHSVMGERVYGKCQTPHVDGGGHDVNHYWKYEQYWLSTQEYIQSQVHRND